MSTPNGRRVETGGTVTMVITRTFQAPIEDVWASVTESERTARWIGPFTGDPDDGFVMLQMTAEGEGPPSRVEIRECVAPRHLALTTGVEGNQWLLEVDLHEADGVTTLEFSQVCSDPDVAASVGPGWEFYLDRLVAAETGGDVEAIDFERDYFPAMEAHYRGLFPR